MDNKLPNDVTSINPNTILQLPMLKEHVTNFTVRNTGPVILVMSFTDTPYAVFTS